jgi:hypothetical protein
MVTVGANIHRPAAIELLSLSEVVSRLREHPPKLHKYRGELVSLIERGVPLGEAKRRTKPMKAAFPAFVPAITDRLAGGQLIETQNLVQIDIDCEGELFTYQYAQEMRAALDSTGAFLLLAISPSFGVKGLLRATGGAYNERAKYVGERLSLFLKNKGFSHFRVDLLPELQCCFFPYDKTLIYNPDAKAYEVSPPQPKPAPPVERKEQVSEVINSEALTRWAVKRAANFAKRKHNESLNNHFARRSFIFMCVIWGVEPEAAFSIGNEIDSLEIEKREFMRRYHSTEKREGFGRARGEAEREYLAERQRQREFMRRSQ